MPIEHDLDTLQTFLEVVGGYTPYSIILDKDLNDVIDKSQIPDLYILRDDLSKFCLSPTTGNHVQSLDVGNISLNYTTYTCDDRNYNVDVFDTNRISSYIDDMQAEIDESGPNESGSDQNQNDEDFGGFDEEGFGDFNEGGAYRGGLGDEDTFSRQHSIYNTDLTEAQRKEINKNIKNTISTETKAFVVKLLRQLNNTSNKCFYKGAFVFADTEQLTLTTMLFNETATIVPTTFESHKKYCSNANKNKWYTNNKSVLRINNKNGINILKYLTKKHVYEVHISLTQHSCQCGNNKVLEYQNVKWYPFIGGNGKNYVFLKLEGYPTMELLHLWHWIVRHGREQVEDLGYGVDKTIKNLKTKLLFMFNKNKPAFKNVSNLDNDAQIEGFDKCPTHREDCSTCSYNGDEKNNNYVLKSYSDNGEIDNYPYKFDNIKRGDEIFVPESMLRNLLNPSSRFDGGRRKTRSKAGGRKTRRKISGCKTRRKISGCKTRRKVSGCKTRRKN